MNDKFLTANECLPPREETPIFSDLNILEITEAIQDLDSRLSHLESVLNIEPDNPRE